MVLINVIESKRMHIVNGKRSIDALNVNGTITEWYTNTEIFVDIVIHGSRWRASLRDFIKEKCNIYLNGWMNK